MSELCGLWVISIKKLLLILLSAMEKHKARKRFGSIRNVGGGTVTGRMGSPHWGDIFKTWKDKRWARLPSARRIFQAEREEKVQRLLGRHMPGMFGGWCLNDSRAGTSQRWCQRNHGAEISGDSFWDEQHWWVLRGSVTCFHVCFQRNTVVTVLWIDWKGQK